MTSRLGFPARSNSAKLWSSGVVASPSTQMTMSAHAPAPSPFGAIGGGASASAVADPPRPARTGGDDVVKQVKRDEPKVGRNDPCPCGSGKKYKKCHGA